MYYKFTESVYNINLSRFLSENKGKTENDYLECEIDRAEKFIFENDNSETLKRNWLQELQEEYKDVIDEDLLNNLIGREIDIKESNLNRNIKIFERSIQFHSKKLKLNRLIDKVDEVDFSNEKDIDKIRFLIKLGVIDNLHTQYFQHSISSLSTAISGVTGIEQATVKGYLNAYLSNPESKQNPMHSEKAVQQIILKLNSIGFKK